MANTLKGLTLKDSYELFAFKSVVNPESYRIRFGAGDAAPLSVYQNTPLFTTLSPDIAAQFLPAGFGALRGVAVGGSGVAMGAISSTGTPSGSGDTARLIIGNGSVSALNEAVKGKATKLVDIRKTTIATPTTVTDQFKVVGLDVESDNSDNRIIEFTTYQDTATPSNSYKEFKFGGAGKTYGNSGQMVLRHEQVSGLGSFHFNISNKISFGSPQFLATSVYATNGSINTSDARLKEGLRDMTVVELDAFYEIAQLPNIWKWVDKGVDDARLHAGCTVQDAISILTKYGLIWSDYSAFCYDEWSDAYDEDGNLISKAGNRYGFRANELTNLIMRAVVEKQKSILERLSKLESGSK